MSIRNPEVIQADRDQFGALALYVVQRPAKAKSVLELEKTGKACLWFRHFPFVFSSASRVGRRRARQIHWLGLIRVIFIRLGVTFVKCSDRDQGGSGYH
jgi:hypothetical protein